jgi:two-component system, OmpR family, response regulator MprA
MRILIVEDDSRMAELLRRGLSKEGHSVELASNGVRGLELARQEGFDAVVLDIMLPGLDGLSIARRLRAGGVRIPILMLTGRDSVPDVVKGLDAGADDYLTKPFSFEVLAARLRAMGRRVTSASDTMIRVADLTLDAETHEVHRGKKAVALTRTEYVLLEHLMRRPGRVVSRDDLIEAVWGIDRGVESNTLDVFIFQLRTKIEIGHASRLIHTVRGFGYTIREREPE